jgi:hypothetical protein
MYSLQLIKGKLSIIKITGLLIILFIFTNHLKGQDLEPRSYAALPSNLNAIAVQAGTLAGNVVSDAALPIQNLDVTTYTGSFGYVRTFGIAGKLARISVGIPFAAISGTAQLNGRDTATARWGFGDIRIRFGINLIGSPALDKKKFTHYTQDLVFGVSLVTSVPTGLYYPHKLINIGNNRWAFKPEAGISKRFSQFYLEAYAGIWFYTDNTDYLGGHTLSQKPMATFQTHVCYYFKNHMWVSADGNWFSGGRTAIDDVPAASDFNNWRIGGAWSVPIARGQSIRLQFNQGAFTNRGYDYTAFSLTYQYVFF